MPILVEPRYNEGPRDYENHSSYSVNCQPKFTYEKLYKSSCPNTKHQKFNLLALRRQNTAYLNQKDPACAIKPLAGLNHSLTCTLK